MLPLSTIFLLDFPTVSFWRDGGGGCCLSLSFILQIRITASDNHFDIFKLTKYVLFDRFVVMLLFGFLLVKFVLYLIWMVTFVLFRVIDNAFIMMILAIYC